MMTAVTPVDLYTAGTISLTNGSDIVLGVGTFWEAVALRGDALWIADRSLLIKEVLADDQIRIVAPWGGDTIADQPYALSYTSWLRYSVAELQGGVRDVIAFWRMGGVRGTREVTLPIDAITVADLNKVVVYDSATAVAASIPQAAADGKLIDGWACWLKVRGAGPVTLTPVTSTINGAASLVLAQGDAAMIWSHGGDYEAAVFHSGEDGVDGATIYVQDEAPTVAGPFASIWIDKDSPDLDVYQLGGDPPAWFPTGANLKGPPGTPGDNGTNGTNGINGASALTVVRTAATANVNIASGLENGDAVSGVTLATNDLVLLTAQTAPAENGVYIVPASGAAARHASFATYDAHPGCYFSVCEGTGVADTLWRCTSDKGGTLGTTAIAISQYPAVRFDAAQSRTGAEMSRARDNIAAALIQSGNWIINGDFTVAVRGSTKTPGTGVYGYDRWKGHASGLVQRVYGLPAREYTLSWTGGGNATFNGITAVSPIVTTWAGGDADIVVPSTAAKVCLTPGNRSNESDVFQPRPHPIERWLCEYYYRRLGPGLLAYANSSSSIFIAGSGGPMRALPTLSVPAGSGAGAVSFIGGGPTDINTINATNVVGTADSFGFWIVGGGSYVSGGWYVTVKHVIVLDADA